jgi:excisionase family DNA binding protein
MADNSTQEVERMLLTPRQAARALAISEKTLYNLTRAGKIVAVRDGRLVRYALADLQAWIDRAKSSREAV